MKTYTLQVYRSFLLIGLSISAVFIWGCPGSGSNQENGYQPNREASLALKLRCVRDTVTDTVPLSPSAAEPNICDDQRISKIEISVYNANTREYVLPEFKVWDCSAHGTGALKVPSGTDLYINLIGYVDNRPCWTASETGIRIGPNDTQYFLMKDLEYQCNDNQPPLILNRIPAPDAQDVGLDESITVVFNEKLAPSTIFNHAITLKDEDNNPIKGDIRHVIETNTIFFNPLQSMEKGTTYTVTLDNDEGNITDTAMIPFGQTLTWQFTTSDDTVTAPAVVGTQPVAGATAVSHRTIIQATFSKPIDFSTVGATEFTVIGNSAQKMGGLDYNAKTNTLSFSPDTPLELDMEYAITLSGQISDQDGVYMGIPFKWLFKTGALLPPADLRIDGNMLRWDPGHIVADIYALFVRTVGQSYDYNDPIWMGSFTNIDFSALQLPIPGLSVVRDPITNAVSPGFLPEINYFFVVRAEINGEYSADSNEIKVSFSN